ncbi:MAG TPA: DUF2497 domain-containing protein, partial [Novosphingobium sp.]|nr:DUF2497 domain-containing protein [Novosphingobium sp.]
MRQAGEPSVEEILESIKKVIARDNRATAAEQRRSRESAGVTPEREAEAEPDVLELADLADIEEAADEAEQNESSLIDDQARVSMQQSFAALAMLAEPGAQPQIVRSGETSLEGLVRELLRP